MKIIGIDPGSTRAGYGVIEFHAQSATFIDGGIFSVTSPHNHQRLKELYDECHTLFKHHRPDVVGMEKLFFGKNIKTATDVSQSRGVIALCIAQYNIPLYEFTPLEVKQGMTGYGSADKKSITRMVQGTLHLPPTFAHVPDDVFDALAIALIAGYTATKERRHSL